MKNSKMAIKSPSLFLAFALLFLSASTFILGAEEASSTLISYATPLPTYEQNMTNRANTLYLSAQSLNSQQEKLENSETETDELSRLLSDQMTDLRLLKQQWTELQTLSRGLRDDNRELTNLLLNSGQIIESLEKRLASATQGVTDALENWWHMEELLSNADNIIDQWERDYIRLQRQQKAQPFAFAICGVVFAGGGTMLGLGVTEKNADLMIAGGSTLVATAAVYFIGHKVFRWW